MIEVFYKTIQDDQFEKISDFRVDSWIHVKEATLEDLQKIAELTGLDISDLHDSLDKYENPHFESKEQNTLLFVRYPFSDEEGLYTCMMCIIVNPSYFITLSPFASPPVEKILKYKTENASSQKSKLLFSLLFEISYSFTTKIKTLRNEVIEQEKKMKNVGNQAIIMLTQNEDILNQYQAALEPMRLVLEGLLSGKYVHLFEKDYDTVQELLTTIRQAEDLCEVNGKRIRSLRDSYQILFTNDVNKTMKILTAITIIVAIPTLIATIWGMNVDLPYKDSPFAFFVLLNVMILFTIISVIVFVKKRWL